MQILIHKIGLVHCEQEASFSSSASHPLYGLPPVHLLKMLFFIWNPPYFRFLIFENFTNLLAK
ncbi:MAG: hypothetical protein CMB48_03330 [Euryarchaeota archaeon]|nr:hypothetical protein [Euryarchaeota archaeon]